MTRKRLTPGEVVIQRFGDAGLTTRALAILVGRDQSRIVRLTKPKSKGGTGGRIPEALQRELLAAAKAAGVKLTADELINGA